MDEYTDSLQILKDKKKLTRDELDEKWAQFKHFYSRLYEQLIMDENFDTDMLKYLCETKEKKRETKKDS